MNLKYWIKGAKVREGHFSDLEDFNNHINPNSQIFHFDGKNEDLECSIKDFGLETLKGYYYYYYQDDDLVYMGETEKERDAFILNELPMHFVFSVDENAFFFTDGRDYSHLI